MSATLELLNAEVQRKLKLENMVLALNGDTKAANIILKATPSELPMYPARSRIPIACFALLAARGLLMAPSVLFCATSCVLMVVIIEFYGAILHIVLDTPEYINLPLIGRGCLEFQWHHLIRQDIATKPFLDVCGDLTVIMTVHLAMMALTFGLSDPKAQFVWGCLVFLAYWGQFSHRQAHMSATKKPSSWVAFCQRHGLLLAPAAHRRHHETYDCEFPILSGFSSPLLEVLVKGCRKAGLAHIWLVLFVGLSFGLTAMCTALACVVSDKLEALLA